MHALPGSVHPRPPARSSRGGVAFALILSAGCLRGGGDRAPEAEAPHARARLVSEAAALPPGSEVALGVTFAIDPGWHLYANWRNDTGLPIAIALRAPEGFEVGPIQWPAPLRLLSDGEILDHVYEREVTLILPVHVPPGATPGSVARFDATVDWLVCGTGCIPGNATLSLELPIAGSGEGPTPSRDAPLFAAARARLPGSADRTAGDIAHRWGAHELTIQAAGTERMAFYPDTGCVRLADPIHDTLASGSSLALRIDPADTSKPVRGVLELWNGDRTRLVHLEIQPPSASEPPG